MTTMDALFSDDVFINSPTSAPQGSKRGEAALFKDLSAWETLPSSNRGSVRAGKKAAGSFLKKTAGNRNSVPQSGFCRLHSARLVA